VLPEDLLEVRRERAQGSAPTYAKRALSEYGKAARAFPNFPNRAVRAFRPNLPALEEFPITLWTQITNRKLRRASMTMLTGCEAMGYGPLREAIAAYASRSRGVVCTAAQVIVTSGVQESLDLVVRLFVNRGDRVCMEDPGYVGAARVFEATGVKIISLPIDKQGAKLPSTQQTARLVYITPAHQAPLGVAMSLTRRLEMLEWARKTNALIFEDDYDGEYRYQGRPLPALQGLDRNGVVLFAGSFSKVLFPALRLGYLIVPEDLAERFASAKSILNRHAPLLEQTVLCEFIQAGHFGRHLRRMREIYSERLGTLLDMGSKYLDGMMEVSKIEAGLQTVGWLTKGLDDREVAKAASARGVDSIALTSFYRSPQELARRERHGLQLGFAAVGPREIRRGVEELARAIEGYKGASLPERTL